MTRKHFMKLSVAAPLLAAVGCKTVNWGDSENVKLIATLEQAAFVAALKLKEDPDKELYLRVAADVIDNMVTDGKLDPTDILYAVVQAVDEKDVVIAVTSVVTIYRIWFAENEKLQSVYAAKLLAAIARGIRLGLGTPQTRALTAAPVPAKVVPATFKSQAVSNAVKDHFARY